MNMPPISPLPTIGPKTEILGLHRILPMAFNGQDLTALLSTATRRIAADPTDAAAMIDLSTVLECQRRSEPARAARDQAVAVQRDFCVVHGNGSGLIVLAFVVAGNFMANTPIDFLLQGSNSVLWLRYVDAATIALDALPEHDVAFLAIGEATAHRPVLTRIAELLPSVRGPVLNGDADRIASLTRDAMSALFAAEPSLLMPPTLQIDRAALEAIGHGHSDLSEHAPGMEFPIIVRPLGSHAGDGLDRLTTAAAALAYLDTADSAQFFVAPFVDYRGGDGSFSKQRVVFVGGQAFPSHLAVSDHWIVHYLSAGMTENAAKRATEAAWMADFDSDFARRHADAFAALNRQIGLDYFGIDCAELSDGRLLVFEIDVAMLVHDMEDGEIFPYKKVAMQKLFDAFVANAAAAAQILSVWPTRAASRCGFGAACQ